MRSMLLGWVLAGLLIPLAAAADDTSLPAMSWPSVFREDYTLDPKGTSQLRLEPEHVVARRFHLRVASRWTFDASLVRAQDGAILWTLHEFREGSALIPWGAGEFGHLTLSNPHDRPIEISVSIATDPDEVGLRVYSFFVNRFFEAYEAGDLEQAERHLSSALAEDQADSTAAILLARMWKARGFTESPDVIASGEDEERVWQEIAESRLLHRLTPEVDHFLAIDDVAAARSVLQPHTFQTPLGIRRSSVLSGRCALREDDGVRALENLYTALDASPDVAARFEVYPWLIRANLLIGNRAQAEAIAARAEAEAMDEESRNAVQEWLEGEN